MAVVVGASLVAIRFLGTSAASEQGKQSDCIAVRPAPAYCTDDFKVGTSTSTTTGGGNGAEVTTTTSSVVTTTTSSTTTTTTAPTTTVAPTSSTTSSTTSTTTAPSTYSGTGAWYGFSRRNLQNSRWEGSVTPLIKNAAGNPVSGVTVVIRWRTSNGQGTVECTTGGNGRCTVSQAISDSRAYVDFTIETVDGLPLASPPAAQRVLQP